MSKHNTRSDQRKWFDSAHASLCVLGTYLRFVGFFRPLEEAVKIKQKEAVIFWLGSLFQGLCPYFEPVAVVAGSLRLGFQEWRSVIHVTPPDPYPR